MKVDKDVDWNSDNGDNEGNEAEMRENERNRGEKRQRLEKRHKRVKSKRKDLEIEESQQELFIQMVMMGGSDMDWKTYHNQQRRESS